MGYNRLKYFQRIIPRDDFIHISNPRIILEIKALLRNCNHCLEPRTASLQLQEYLRNLEQFAQWLGEDISEFNAGYRFCKESIEQTILLLNRQQKMLIPGAKCRKLRKEYLYGLNRILSGLRLAFDPLFISKTRLTARQISTYILDRKEGLGQRYQFNTSGEHAPANKLGHLTRAEIEAALKLLARPNPGDIRTTRNGWLDFGSGSHTLVRILGKKKLGKDRIYFVYYMAEHLKKKGPYQKTLETLTPETAPAAFV